ncbi:putative group 3/4 sigma-70 RNA polymerase sigma factor [Fischerella sp. NIES-4106]|nr:putative group 3/4 sigma-70 RNA polymerase sigma factor [Fischerella sp. NIES-4106]
MKKREDIIEKFSTFLSFGNPGSDGNPIWRTDPELERCMRSLVESQRDANEEFWAQYFLKVIREKSTQQETETQEQGEQGGQGGQQDTGNFSASPHHPSGGSLRDAARTQSLQRRVPPQRPPHRITTSSFIAGKHLSAYLQEACLWASQKSYQRFKYLQHKYPLEEFFQIANAAANPASKLLKNFNFEYPLTNIEGYAKTAIIRLISNTIYQHDLEAKRGKFSDYGLLKDLNTKELREALLYQGINHTKLDLYCLVWQCLDKIYQPARCQGGRSLEPPNQQHLQEIAYCYNQKINKLDFPTTSISSEKVQHMLSICVRSARDYRTKRFLPLEEYDNVSDPIPTLWDNLIQQETWEQVQSIVSNLFASLPEAGQTIFKLWQGLNLTQTEIAIILKNKYPDLQKQYQVARHSDRYIRNLLKKIAIELNKLDPDICFKNEKELENIKDAMNECLRFHCQKIFYSTLDKIIEQFPEQEKISMLTNQIHTLEQTNYQQITVFISEGSQIISHLKKYLAICFKNELEESIKLEKNSLAIVNHKIADFVEEWLKTKFYFTNQG